MKTVVKKASTREVLLICSAIPRFSSYRRLQPLAKKKSSRRLAIRGRRHLRFSLFLFLLSYFISLFLAADRLISSGSGRRWSKSYRPVSGDNRAETVPIDGITCDHFPLLMLPGHLSEEPRKFESIFKISRKTFNYICSLVRDDLMAKTSNFAFADGKFLSVEDQVAVALRRLSSGESLLNVGVSFGMNQSTVAQVTWRFVEAMEERALHHLRWPTTQEMKDIKSKLEKIWGLPNCCGVIDATHITMCLSTVDTSSKIWVDHENNHSMVLQAIIDPEMRFRDIVTGWPGSMNELTVLRSSGFFKMCEKGTRLDGETAELPNGLELREYIIGDSDFPLLPWLLTPYQGKDLSDAKTEFNKRLSAAGLVAQRALASLKAMWKIIQGAMWRPDKHRLPRIILVCCLLQNIIIDLDDEVRHEMPWSHEHDTSYKQQLCDMADNNGVTLRDQLSRYLSCRLLP
ncbi:hypothetical protein GW17_00006542 [Ensete ventricosum]|nr:hypothetical protein GW17_00006542 [Ensete ventricosum]